MSTVLLATCARVPGGDGDAQLLRAGYTAPVQPYLVDVDTRGKTALVRHPLFLGCAQSAATTRATTLTAAIAARG